MWPTAIVPNSPQVDLGQFAGREGQRQKRLTRARADGAHIIFDDADPAIVAGLAQALEDLPGGQRMGIEPADDAALEGIE
ncbi:MAG TPA: hypothetical protein VLT83_13830, partial [Opitutaceae bacterium]|nr:hypothetical protein [Opitutaceae bacterium]